MKTILEQGQAVLWALAFLIVGGFAASIVSGNAKIVPADEPYPSGFVSDPFQD